MARKKFEKIMMRNTLAMMLPIIVFLVVLIFVGVRYSFLHELRSYEIGNVENVEERIEQLYEAGTTSIKYVAKDIYYTGFDYFVDGKVKGAYYYNIQEDHLLLYLIKTKNPKMYIEEKTLKGRIIKDTVVTEHIISEFAAGSELAPELFSNFVGTYIISEPDYPYVYAGIVYILAAALIAVCVLIIGYMNYLWQHPQRHPQARQLRAYGKRNQVIETLNRELATDLYYKYHGVYVTANYLIVSYWFHTDVIRLDDVRYLSKNRVETKHGREIFRLTLAEPETDLFYELDFKDEPLIDAVVEAIRGSEE